MGNVFGKWTRKQDCLDLQVQKYVSTYCETQGSPEFSFTTSANLVLSKCNVNNNRITSSVNTQDRSDTESFKSTMGPSEALGTLALPGDVKDDDSIKWPYTGLGTFHQQDEERIDDRTTGCPGVNPLLNSMAAEDDRETPCSFRMPHFPGIEIKSRSESSVTRTRIKTVDGTGTGRKPAKVDTFILELACQICIPYFVEQLCNVSAYCDQLLRTGCGIEPTQESDIQHAGSRDAQVKCLLFHLIQNRNLHRLFKICGSDNIRQGFIKDKISAVSEDLQERWRPYNDPSRTKFMDIQVIIARAILIRVDSPRYLPLIKEYLQANLQVTMSLLERLVKYGIIGTSEADTLQAQDPDTWAALLVTILSNRTDGSLFAFLAVLGNELPSTWKKMDEFITSGAIGGQDNSQDQEKTEAGCVAMKMEKLTKKADELYTIDLLAKGTTAYNGVEEVMDRYTARIKKIIPGCVKFILQFETIRGLLQCWLDYIDGVLVGDISKIMAEVRDDKSPGLEAGDVGTRIHIEHQSFLDALNKLATESEASGVPVESNLPLDSDERDIHNPGESLRGRVVLKQQAELLKWELNAEEEQTSRKDHVETRLSEGYWSQPNTPAPTPRSSGFAEDNRVKTNERASPNQ